MASALVQLKAIADCDHAPTAWQSSLPVGFHLDPSGGNDFAPFWGLLPGTGCFMRSAASVAKNIQIASRPRIVGIDDALRLDVGAVAVTGGCARPPERRREQERTMRACRIAVPMWVVVLIIGTGCSSSPSARGSVRQASP